MIKENKTNMTKNKKMTKKMTRSQLKTLTLKKPQCNKNNRKQEQQKTMMQQTANGKTTNNDKRQEQEDTPPLNQERRFKNTYRQPTRTMNKMERDNDE